MNQETRSSLQSATQELRQLLETEFSEQLSGTFDILPDGTIAKQPGQHLVDPKQRLIRRKVVEATEYLISGGKTAQEAVQDYIREASFTFLNRVVALRMMEARGLLQPCISKGDQSSGFKEFCGLAPGLSSLPDGGYRLYLECLFDELSVEIKVLFNRRDAASLLWPRRTALNKLLEILGRDDLAGAWGADETIGWVYQDFNDKDLEVFRENQSLKVSRELLPAKTQKFTPRWIVKLLVENSLGRMWLQMHPDSEIATRFDYLVPSDDAISEELKPVSAIRLIDPACGTMHFGLVAFDLFREMYLEEIANAGKPGWPERPSVNSESEIPSSIIANNLFGIDIDPRAVQLSALTLYLKAKSLNPKAQLTDTRLACADVHMLNGDHLGDFLAASGLNKRPIFERILKALQERLRNAEQLGSLLRLDQDIRELIEKERTSYRKDGVQPDLFGWSKEQFESEAGTDEFWEVLEIQIVQALDAFAREQAEKGTTQTYFTGEAVKGLRLLHLLSQKYDVVVANPPYLDSRDMNSDLKKFIESEFKSAKRNLFSAFCVRCMELLQDGGRFGAITGQTFMFISTFEEFRKHLANSGSIEVLSQFDYGLFAGVRVDTAAFVLRREADEQARNESVGTYFRLVKQPDAESKRERFEQAAANLRSGKADSIVYRYKQADFDAIPGSPWVYWITQGLREIFNSGTPLSKFSKPGVGQNTGDNARFLRFWWEVGYGRVTQGCRNQDDADKSCGKWFPYMKGGSFQRWYGNQNYVINWLNDGIEVKAFAVLRNKGKHWSRYLQNLHYNFAEGVTWSDLTSGRFSCRYRPIGFLCDVKGSSACTDEPNVLLAILNSSLAHYFLNLLNPTVSFQVGDISRIPLPSTYRELESTDLVDKAIQISRTFSEQNETTWDFTKPIEYTNGIENHVRITNEIRGIEQRLDSLLFKIYGISNDDQLAISNELNETPPPCLEEDNDDSEDEGSDDDEIVDETSSLDAVRTARDYVGYSIGIVLGRFLPGVENALGRGDFSPETSKQLRDLADSDGVLVLDAGHPQDLAAKVHQALNLMLGENDARDCIHEATGRDGDLDEELRRYFAGDFFKEHLQKYRKRPVYWLLQSPRKTYGVYLFHERITKDTLYRIRSDQYLGSKLKLLNSRLDALQQEAEGASGRELKTLQKSIEETEAARDDLEAFASLIDNLIALGYEPNIDDGVLINMAPLWQLIPSWSAEPKKCWDKLVAGDFDWSHTAMRLWPERVIPKCVENASYAIAHGLDTVFWTQDDRDRFQPKPKPDGGWKQTIEKLVAERTRPGVKEALARLIEATSVKKVSKRGRERR